MDARWTVETVTADRLLFPGRGLWGGFILLTSATNAGVTVYDGLDEKSGRQLAVLQGFQNVPVPFTFEFPIPIDRGLYIDVGSDITSIMIVFKVGE